MLWDAAADRGIFGQVPRVPRGSLAREEPAISRDALRDMLKIVLILYLARARVGIHMRKR